MREPSPPHPAQRPLLTLMLVAGILVAGFLAFRVYDAGTDLQGEEVLVVERQPDVRQALHLDVARTQAEAPLLAEVLDRAWVGGKATSNDPAVVAQARAYLDGLAQEQNVTRFTDPPIDGAFNWGLDDEARTFRVLFL